MAGRADTETTSVPVSARHGRAGLALRPGEIASELDTLLGDVWPERRGIVLARRTMGDADRLIGTADIPSVMGRFAASWPASDARATGSLWFQWHTGLVWPVLALAALRLGALPVFGQTRIQVSDAGRPVGLVVGPERLVGSAPVLLRHLLFDAGEALIRRVAGISGLAPRALYGSAAAILAWTVGELATRLGEAGTSALDEMLRTPGAPEGGPNPYARALRRDETGAVVGRRVCCVRDRLPEVPTCADCPARRAGDA